MLIRLILCIDDRAIVKHLRQSFTQTDLFLECHNEPQTVWQKAIRSCGDVIVISKGLIPQPEEINIALLNELPERPTTVILHQDKDPESQAQLVAAGADVVLDMGISPRSLVEAIQTVLESRRQYAESRLQGGRSDFRPSIADFGSKSETMRIFLQEVRRVTASGAPLLVMGETGVGKEHLARAIHLESPRSSAEFVAVNTAALPDQLLESELFGHTEGAFTGATRARRGAFELAHQGTLFLDEIGEMPIHLQAKLLRALQDYEVKLLGSEQPIWVDVRVIAATSVDLEEQVRQKAFRQDLFYRLNVVPLTIPPLRERPEDIPILVEKFLERWRYRSGQEIENLAPDVLDAFCQYDWPGNVRELFNILERALLLGEENRIEFANLPQAFSDHGIRSNPSQVVIADPDQWPNASLAQIVANNVETTERCYLEAVLRKTRGRVGQAAVIAGISPRSLYMKLKKYEIDKKAFKRHRAP